MIFGCVSFLFASSAAAVNYDKTTGCLSGSESYFSLTCHQAARLESAGSILIVLWISGLFIKILSLTKFTKSIRATIAPKAQLWWGLAHISTLLVVALFGYLVLVQLVRYLDGPPGYEVDTLFGKMPDYDIRHLLTLVGETVGLVVGTILESIVARTTLKNNVAFMRIFWVVLATNIALALACATTVLFYSLI
jgi:hypothetical protein